MYRFIILIAFLLFVNALHAQEVRDFTYYDKTSYQLYLAANWDDVIIIGNESIEQGIDFYYLRMRLGIAYYELGNYVKAKNHFQKALQFYPESQDATSYLHYCLGFLGRTMDANAFYDVENDNLKIVRSIYFEPGIKIADGSSATGNVSYFFLGMNHDLGKRVSLFHGYQLLKADFTTILSSGGGPGTGNGSGNFEYSYTITQNEYYLSPTFLLSKGLYLLPTYHFQDVRTTDYHARNHLLGLQIVSWWGRAKFYGGYYYSEINTLYQEQVEAGLVFYPLGNTNFYLQAQGTFHFENSRKSHIGTGAIGVRLFPKTWAEGKFVFGDMLNFSESNGYIFYNQLDMIKWKWGITLHQYLGKHLLLLNYTQEHKEESGSGNPFVHHTIVIGLNLSF